MSLPRIRTVPTASGATAVQVIWRYVDRKPVLDHIGSAHSDEELALLVAKAQRLIDGDQLAFDIDTTGGVGNRGATGSADSPFAITSERAGYLLDAIRGAFSVLGLDTATGDDRVFYDLVAARIISPGSKFESIETLEEVGVQSASYSTIQRHLPGYATAEFLDRISGALASYAGIGPGVIVLYDVTTLYFETDKEAAAQTGFSKERRLESQITVGMLTDATGLPLSIGAFEGNRAETHTMLPMIQRLAQAYNLDDITVVADAGMFSAANKQAIVDAGLGYILGTKQREIPAVINSWRTQHPGQDYTHGQIWSAVNPAGVDKQDGNGTRLVTYYQYSQDRARRTLKGVAEQVAKAERAVAGTVPVKRNRYVNLKAPHKAVNYKLAEKHRALAGIKGYETNRLDFTAEQVIDAYRRLFKIEKSFRMAKSDLQARPIYHRKKDSIDAHLAVVMCAMACGHVLEQATGLSLKRLVRTLKKYRSITLNINGQTVYAHAPLPADVSELIEKLPKSD
ncbi:IS1634 family transposase [Corynebacterium lizhenjunii]|uniref:IS1634 family transposase n=1 Tax=Corynebacterium lizhenjunii TaxID=2709394 RepID=A0A7T0KFD2_9CORY|nr:IS1634 family transposase [Corynebacterium lizhenjunii]QPK79285.1 IS1634 family transposase [Corynebacterium lizhenjunii]